MEAKKKRDKLGRFLERKRLMNQSYEFGLKAFGKLPSSPSLNKEFMDTVPNCEMGDDEGTSLRISMYKWYVRGWTDANLRRVF